MTAPGRARAQINRALIIDTGSGDHVPVMYNPEEYKLEQGNEFAEIGMPGLDTSPVQYVRGKARTLRMELFFDTYEDGTDVRAHTRRGRRPARPGPAARTPRRSCCSSGRLLLPAACSSRPASASRCSCATAPRCAPGSSVRFQEYVDLEVETARRLLRRVRRRCTTVHPARHAPRARRRATSATRRAGGRSPRPTASTIRSAARRRVAGRSRDGGRHGDRRALRAPRRGSTSAASRWPPTSANQVSSACATTTTSTSPTCSPSSLRQPRQPVHRLARCSISARRVEIHMGYGDDLRPMMLGEITAIEPSFPQSGAPTLTVSGYDRSYQLRHDQPRPARVQVHQRQPDRRPRSRWRPGCPGGRPVALLPARALPQTGSDMAFLKERAPRQLLRRLRRAGTGSTSSSPGRRPRRSRSSGAATCRVRAAALARGHGRRPGGPRLQRAPRPGRSSASLTTAALGLDDLLERLGEAGVATLAARSGRRVVARPAGQLAARRRRAGQARAPGHPRRALRGQRLVHRHAGAARGHDSSRSTGVGKRFSGRYRLSKVSHTLDDGGLPHRRSRSPSGRRRACWASAQGDGRAAAAPAREPFDGVVVGQVRAGRPAAVQGPGAVARPRRGRTLLTVPCASFMAGSDGGARTSCPRSATRSSSRSQAGTSPDGYVLGCLWSLADAKPALQPGLQRIRSRTGHTISLDDADGAITVEHPLGASVTLAADGVGQRLGHATG